MADTVKTTIELPADLHYQVKLRALQEGSDLRSLVIEGLELRLKRKARKRKGVHR